MLLNPHDDSRSSSTGNKFRSLPSFDCAVLSVGSHCDGYEEQQFQGLRPGSLRRAATKGGTCFNIGLPKRGTGGPSGGEHMPYPYALAYRREDRKTIDSRSCMGLMILYFENCSLKSLS
jgi:hypothetical protein